MGSAYSGWLVRAPNRAGYDVHGEKIYVVGLSSGAYVEDLIAGPTETTQLANGDGVVVDMKLSVPLAEMAAVPFGLASRLTSTRS